MRPTEHVYVPNAVWSNFDVCRAGPSDPGEVSVNLIHENEGGSYLRAIFVSLIVYDGSCDEVSLRYGEVYFEAADEGIRDIQW